MVKNYLNGCFILILIANSYKHGSLNAKGIW